MEPDFKVGANYCFSIPPGWIIVGKVARVTNDAIFLDDSFHLENVADEVSALALGLADKIEKAVTKSYPLPPGVRIDLRAALISSPCAIDITKLSLAHAANAIRGRK
jgi:hypothetical protein